MKALKPFISLCLILALVMSLQLNVFATELAGDEVVDCNITIKIYDLSGEYPGEAVTVHFKDVTGTAEKSIKLTKKENWDSGKEATFTLPAPTTYNFTFEGLADGYEIIDVFPNSPAVTSFAATRGLKDFTWGIVTKEQALEGSEAADDSIGSVITATDRANIAVTNEDAEKAYLEFLEAVSFIQTDASWYEGFSATLTLFDENTLNGELYAEWYASYVQDGTREEFFSLTPFERFLWSNTYTRLAYAVGGSNNFNRYFGSKDSFKYNLVDVATNTMYGNNREVVVEAYEKLMDWQWAYITENGVPFNFIRNRDYIEELNAAEPYVPQIPQTEPEETPEQAPTSPSLETTGQDVTEEVQEETDPTEQVEHEERGIWSDTFSILAENAVTVIILAALVIAVAVLVYIRKTKNVDEG